MAAAPRRAPTPRRMRLTGLHHVTAICADLERTTAFYRDVLGLALVARAPTTTTPTRATSGSATRDGTPGHARLVPGVPAAAEPAGGPRRRRTTSPSASARPRSRSPGATTCARAACDAPRSSSAAAFASIYLRDPDGHIVEIAPRPGLSAAARSRGLAAGRAAAERAGSRRLARSGERAGSCTRCRSRRAARRARGAGARSSTRSSCSRTSGSTAGIAGSGCCPSAAGS